MDVFEVNPMICELLIPAVLSAPSAGEYLYVPMLRRLSEHVSQLSGETEVRDDENPVGKAVFRVLHQFGNGVLFVMSNNAVAVDVPQQQRSIGHCRAIQVHHHGVHAMGGVTHLVYVVSHGNLFGGRIYSMIFTTNCKRINQCRYGSIVCNSGQ